MAQQKQEMQWITEAEKGLIHQLALLRARLRDPEHVNGFEIIRNTLETSELDEYEAVDESVVNEAKRRIAKIDELFEALRREMRRSDIRCFVIARLGEKLTKKLAQWEPFILNSQFNEEIEGELEKQVGKSPENLDGALKDLAWFDGSPTDPDGALRNLGWAGLLDGIAIQAINVGRAAKEFKEVSPPVISVKKTGFFANVLTKLTSKKEASKIIGGASPEIIIRKSAVKEKSKELELRKDDAFEREKAVLDAEYEALRSKQAQTRVKAESEHESQEPAQEVKKGKVRSLVSMKSDISTLRSSTAGFGMFSRASTYKSGNGASKKDEHHISSGSSDNSHSTSTEVTPSSSFKATSLPPAPSFTSSSQIPTLKL